MNLMGRSVRTPKRWILGADNPLTLVGGIGSAVSRVRCHRVPREGGVEALQVRSSRASLANLGASAATVVFSIPSFVSDTDTATVVIVN